MDDQSKFYIVFNAHKTTKFMSKEVKYYEIEYFEIMPDSSVVSLSLIERRYKHFVWLRDKLMNQFFGYVIPVLPEKLINYDVDKRINGFKDFIEKIIDQSILFESDAVQKFLTEGNLNVYIENNPAGETLFQTLTTSVSDWYNYFLGGNVTICTRTLDSQDKDFESIKIELNDSHKQMEKFFRTAQEIISNFEMKTKSIIDMRTIFDSTGQNTAHDMFNRIVKYHQFTNQKFNELVLCKLELLCLDVLEACKLIDLRTDLLNSIHKYEQTIQDPSQQGSKAKIQHQISTLKRDQEKFQMNFKDNLIQFSKFSLNRFETILNNFKKLIEQFNSSIANLEYPSMKQNLHQNDSAEENKDEQQ